MSLRYLVSEEREAGVLYVRRPMGDRLTQRLAADPVMDLAESQLLDGWRLALGQAPMTSLGCRCSKFRVQRFPIARFQSEKARLMAEG